MEVGSEFTTDGTTYRVTRIEAVGDNLPHVRKKMIETDKVPAIYYAGNVLQNGKTGKRGGMFYRFNSGNMIKVL